METGEGTQETENMYLLERNETQVVSARVAINLNG